MPEALISLIIIFKEKWWLKPDRVEPNPFFSRRGRPAKGSAGKENAARYNQTVGVEIKPHVTKRWRRAVKASLIAMHRRAFCAESAISSRIFSPLKSGRATRYPDTLELSLPTT